MGCLFFDILSFLSVFRLFAIFVCFSIFSSRVWLIFENLMSLLKKKSTLNGLSVFRYFVILVYCSIVCHFFSNYTFMLCILFTRFIQLFSLFSFFCMFTFFSLFCLVYSASVTLLSVQHA